MPGNMTLAVLREYLHGEVDEKLLHYIAMNAHKILYISFEQLCERANVTEDQAIAFFRAFNSDSFVAFKYILRKCLYYESTDRGVIKRSLASVSDESVRFGLNNLLQYSSILDYDKIEQLADDIWNVPEVDLFFGGPSRALGDALAYQFTQMRIRSNLFSSKESPSVLDTLSPANLVFVFGFARYDTRLLVQMKLLHQRGFRIVCITDAADSPFIPFSNYHFILPNDSFDFLESYIAGMAFIHTLILALGMQREESLFSRMHSWDIVTQETNMFW